MRKKRSAFLSKSLSFVFLIIVAFLSKAVFEKWQDFRKAKEIFEGMKNAVQVLEDKKEEIDKKFSLISTPEGLKRYIKEKLDLAEKNEKVIYVIEQKNEALKKENLSFFEKIKNFLKNKIKRK